MDLEVVQRLEKLQLSGKEDGGVDLDLNDVYVIKELCESSLVGRIIGEFSVNYTGLK